MTDDKIKRLRSTAELLTGNGWPNASRLMVEAASELERLGKIEAAAKAWHRERGSILAGHTTLELVALLESNSVPKSDA